MTHNILAVVKSAILTGINILNISIQVGKIKVTHNTCSNLLHSILPLLDFTQIFALFSTVFVHSDVMVRLTAKAKTVSKRDINPALLLALTVHTLIAHEVYNLFPNGTN